MVRTILICCALLGLERGDDEQTPAATSTDLAGYQTAKSQSRPRCRMPTSGWLSGARRTA